MATIKLSNLVNTRQCFDRRTIELACYLRPEWVASEHTGKHNEIYWMNFLISAKSLLQSVFFLRQVFRGISSSIDLQSVTGNYRVSIGRSIEPQRAGANLSLSMNSTGTHFDSRMKWLSSRNPLSTRTSCEAFFTLQEISAKDLWIKDLVLIEPMEVLRTSSEWRFPLLEVDCKEFRQSATWCSSARLSRLKIQN